MQSFDKGLYTEQTKSSKSNNIFRESGSILFCVVQMDKRATIYNGKFPYVTATLLSPQSPA